MPSVAESSIAERVMRMLGERVLAIRGEGDYINDVEGRVFFNRPSFDLEVENVPAVFIARRIGGGTTIDRRPGFQELADKTVIFDVVGCVARGQDCSLAAETLLADLERAIELNDDMFLQIEVSGRKQRLLCDELQIVDVQLEPHAEGFPYELTGVGVQCTWTRMYGDPRHVG